MLQDRPLQDEQEAATRSRRCRPPCLQPSGASTTRSLIVMTLLALLQESDAWVRHAPVAPRSEQALAAILRSTLPDMKAKKRGKRKKSEDDKSSKEPVSVIEGIQGRMPDDIYAAGSEYTEVRKESLANRKKKQKGKVKKSVDEKVADILVSRGLIAPGGEEIKPGKKEVQISEEGQDKLDKFFSGGSVVFLVLSVSTALLAVAQSFSVVLFNEQLPEWLGDFIDNAFKYWSAPLLVIYFLFIASYGILKYFQNEGLI